MRRIGIAQAGMLSSVAVLLATAGGFAAGPPQTAPTSTPASAPARDEQIRAWIQSLTEQSAPAAKRAACLNLLASGWPEAVSALAETLVRGQDPATKVTICEAIAAQKEPPPALADVLRALLDNPDARVTAGAAAALGAYRNAGIVDALARDAADHGLPLSRRTAAILALTQARDAVRAIEALLGLLDDPDGRIRAAATAALPRLAPVDMGSDAAAWREWWKTGREDLLNSLSRRLRAQERQYEILEARYLELLRGLVEKAPDDRRDAQLLTWLQSPLAFERRAAVLLIHARLRDAKMPSAAVAAAVRQTIADPDPRVRREVVSLIRDLREPRDAAVLLARLSEETDRLVRPAIYGALGRLGSPAAFPACIAALADPNEGIVAEAVTALGWLVQQHRETGGRENDEAIQAVLQRFNPLPAAPDLRERVVDAMAKMQDVRFAPLLRGAAGAGESNAVVRVAAVRGLGLLGDVRNIDVVEERLGDADAGVREAAIAAMGALGRTRDHLARLGRQLDPAVEPVKANQDYAWDAYRAVFTRLDTPSQLAVLREFDGKGDPVAGGRYVQLISAVEQRLGAMNPPPPELGTVRAQTGEALARVGRDTDAAAMFEKAMPLLSREPAEIQRDVFLKLLTSLLRAGQSEKAVGLVFATSAPTSRPNGGVLGNVFTAHLADLLAANKPDAAIDLIDRLTPTAEASLGAEAAAKLVELRRQAVQAQQVKDRENVQKWVADLKQGGEAATNASVMIRQLGPRAVGPLRDEIRKLVGAGAGDRTLETTLVDLLKQVAPDWPGYSPDAKTEVKLKALQGAGGTP